MMLNQYQVEQAQSRRESEVAERLCVRSLELQPRSNGVRRAVGRSMISIGARLAAEPQPRLARSR
jgi:hypothetical protein